MKERRRPKRGKPAAPRRARLVAALVGVCVLSVGAYGLLHGRPPLSAPKSESSPIRFTDARQQAAEFVAYDHAIVLTSEQKKVMDDALTTIPAPCCAQYSIATCCCPCNLAKSTWGLAKLLITRQRATVAQVKSAAIEWLQFSNPHGYTGNACFTGGCERAFERNGCGGMHEDHIT